MGDEPTNGNVLRFRVDRVEHRVKGAEQACKWIAEKGAKANEQLRVHDEQFRDVERRLGDVEETMKDVPVLHERVDTVIEGVKAARNALWAAAGSFLVLAATVVWQASQ